VNDCPRPVYKLSPIALSNSFEKHEYLEALHCAIGQMCQKRDQAKTDCEIEEWEREIAAVREIVGSIKYGEYRPADQTSAGGAA